MKSFKYYILLLILIVMSNRLIGQNDEVLMQFINQIDSSSEDRIPNILKEIKQDKNVFKIHNDELNTLEYLLLGFYSKNLNINRINFIKYVINNNPETIKNKLIVSLFNYSEGKYNKVEKQTLENCYINDFNETLNLSLEIKNYEFSLNKDNFINQIDSFYNAYSKIPKHDTIYYSFLPLVDLAIVWYEKFPNDYSKEFSNLIYNSNNQFYRAYLDILKYPQNTDYINLCKSGFDLSSIYKSSFGHLDHYYLFDGRKNITTSPEEKTPFPKKH
jgi:Txe/YoeB family toxin of Txe-Axe toxin-antitoxin module